MKKISAFIDRIEATSMKRTILTLFSWIFLRIFFEAIFEASHRIGYIPFSYKALIIYFVHYPSFYLSLFLIIIVITVFITGEKIQRITAAFSYGFGFVLFIPIIDWLISGGSTITYPLRIGPYLLNSLNPFASITEYGGSPGQRIIFFIICFVIGIYVHLKTRKISSSIVAFLLTYLTIILLGGLPTLIAGNKPENLFITGGVLYSDTQKFASIFLLLLFFAVIIYLYLLDKEKFKLIILSLRPERAIFYGGVGIFGLLLALHQSSISMNEQFPLIFDKIGIVILMLSLAFGFQGAAAINDFFDKESDSLTRSRNPLTKGLTVRYYSSWTAIIIGFSLTFSLLINYVSFLTMLSLIFISIIYSMPPVRLKKLPIISSFVLAVAAVLSMAIGYSIIAGGKVLSQMPGAFIIPTLIGITLGFSAKDIRDIRGDKKVKVLTLPMIFYTKDGRILRLPIALIISSSYLFYPLFVKQLFIGSSVCAIITFVYTLLAKRINEWFYFLLLYAFSAYLILMLNNIPILP